MESNEKRIDRINHTRSHSSPIRRFSASRMCLAQVVAMGQAFNAKIMLLHILDKNRTDASTRMLDLLNWQIKKMEAKLYLEKNKCST